MCGCRRGSWSVGARCGRLTGQTFQLGPQYKYPWLIGMWTAAGCTKGFGLARVQGPSSPRRRSLTPSALLDAARGSLRQWTPRFF